MSLCGANFVVLVFSFHNEVHSKIHNWTKWRGFSISIDKLGATNVVRLVSLNNVQPVQ